MKLKEKKENWRTGEDGCGSYSCPAVLLSEHVPNKDGFQILPSTLWVESEHHLSKNMNLE